MKILDHTPFQDASGQINLINRIQGTLKYGLSWYATLEAQKKVIAILNKVLERGYILIRNKELGASGIVAPLVLIGSAGMYLINVTQLSGFYEARGNEWGTLTNERFQPVPPEKNIIAITDKLARVLMVYYERQGIKLPVLVEPVLMASDPGLHLTSTRPIVRVVQSDAIQRFAENLLSARPSLNAQMVNELAERLITPRSAKEQEAPPPAEESDPYAAQDEAPFPMEPSRLSSILNAPKSDVLIDTSDNADIGFAFEEVRAKEPTVMVSNPPSPQERRAAAKPAPKRYFGMSVMQIALLAFMAIVEFCVLAGGFLFIYNQSKP